MTRLAWAVIVVSLLIAMIASCVGGVSPPLDLPTSKPETLVKIVEVERKVVVPVTVPVPVTVEVPMPQTVLVEKFVEVPATVEVTREVAATVEVTREVTVEKLERVLEIVDRAVTVEVVKQTTKYIEVPTTVEVPIVYEIEVTREVPVTVEVIRDVEVPVEKFVPVKEFATVEIEIEVEVTRIVEVHRVVTATPTVTPTPTPIFFRPFPYAVVCDRHSRRVQIGLGRVELVGRTAPATRLRKRRFCKRISRICDLHREPWEFRSRN